MTNSPKRKIVTIAEAARLTSDLRAAGKGVALAHGVFDLLHIGHLRHLKLARNHGDALIVSVTADAFVNKGPGRPVFPDGVRAEVLAALNIVDYVVISHHPSSVPMLREIKPTIYVMGAEYADASKDVTGKIVDERRAVEAGGGRIVFTDDIVHSSSSLINQFLDIYDPSLRAYLDTVRSSALFDRIMQGIERIRDFRVLLVGDAIIDEYQYVTPMGKSPKENMIASRFTNREVFAGGVIAAANHVAGFCREVEVITALGDQHSYEDLIRTSLKPNVGLHAFYRAGAPTTRKCRFIDPAYIRKLFEVYFFEDGPLECGVQSEIDRKIEAVAGDFDLVIVTDFGHGLIAPSTIDSLTRSANFLAVNAQSNSANHGYNLVTRYPRADFVCIDAPEARLAVSDAHSPIETVIRDQLARRVRCDRFIVTAGKSGCITYDTNLNDMHHIPAFTKTVVDTVGAGDAFLSVTSPLVAAGMPLDCVGFVGNAVGAIKVGIVGHRSAVEMAPLTKYITALLK